MDRPSHAMQRAREPSSQKTTPRSTPVQFPPFLPPTAQPPMQIPFSDPFQTRDPFLPSSQHNRRGSYGQPGGQPPNNPAGEGGWNGTNARQPHLGHSSHSSQSAATPNSQPHMGLAYDSARRRSLGGPGSPPRYVGGPLEAPPPPSFAARNMPPPSPQSHHPSSGPFSSSARGPPTASPFGGMHDLSSFASRSAGGMSISSLIAGDGSKHADRSSMASTNGSPMSTNASFAPQRARSTSMRSEYSPQHRPMSPPRQPERFRDPYRAFGLEASAPPVQQSHYAQQPRTTFRAYQPASPRAEDMAGRARYPPRPTSQPIHPAMRPQDRMSGNDQHEESQYARFRQFAEQSAPPYDPAQAHPASEAPERALFAATAGQARDGRFRTVSSPEPRQVNQFSLFNGGQGQLGSQETRRDEYPGLFRPAYSAPSRKDGEAARDDLIAAQHRPQPGSHGAYRASATPPRSTAYDHGPRQFREYAPLPHDHAHALNGDVRHEADEATQRSLLAVSPELGRRNGGRASPLPQAVQGAQPRMVGAGRDPSIKIEFGRMFSGLGSGVGRSSTPTAGLSGTGPGTPSRMSPSRAVEGGDAASGLVHNSADGRAQSVTLGKNGRKSKTGTPKIDSDSEDGRDTPTGTRNASKRLKTGHSTHHHHRHAHPHGHHHHHRHHNGMEDPQSRNNSPIQPLQFPPPTNQSQPPAAHHHHHHHATHARASHYHHHQVKSATALSPPKVPVSNAELLKSAAMSSRRHLGSMLYSSTLSMPSNKRSALEARFAFDSTANPVPRFEDRINCTFTVRVPRGYLGASDATTGTAGLIAGGLEGICNRRAVWGTEVYSDDSDVVAAAVHSGWIKGDFGEYNEELADLFDCEFEDAETVTGDPASLDKKPIRPVRVPSERDMQVTILILPPLATYPSTSMHNMRSRAWGSNHDGMSFMVHSIKFVNEPRATRYAERGPAARRQRMREDQLRRREARESLAGLQNGGSSVSVGA